MERTELHCRRIDIRGFRRSDGLFEVEGRIIDTKPHDINIDFGRNVPATTPLHNLGVRLVYDIDLLVHDVTTFTEAAPYAICPGGGLALKAVIGLRMVAGWNQAVRNSIDKAHSCTHLVELLGPLATVAFQTISSLRPPQNAVDKNGRPLKINSCYAYAADGEMVAKRWPEFYEDKNAFFKD